MHSGYAWRQLIDAETERIRDVMKQLIATQVGYIVAQVKDQLDQHRRHYEIVIRSEMENVKKGVQHVQARLEPQHQPRGRQPVPDLW
jgi:hypothetical protein